MTKLPLRYTVLSRSQQIAADPLGVAATRRPGGSRGWRAGARLPSGVAAARRGGLEPIAGGGQGRASRRGPLRCAAGATVAGAWLGAGAAVAASPSCDRERRALGMGSREPCVP